MQERERSLTERQEARASWGPAGSFHNSLPEELTGDPTER